MKYEITLLLFISFMLQACTQLNVTLYSPDGKIKTKCAVATCHDEGGVCWTGKGCSGGVNASMGCWTQQPMAMKP